MSKKYYRVPSPGFCKNPTEPWKYYLPPFRMAPHVYCVGGNVDVGVYLLDTGSGLILIDTGMAEWLYLIVDSIHRLGFDPRNVKHILLSHFHGDHVNGATMLQKMSGAKIWMSKEDNAYRKIADLHFCMDIPYSVDCYFDDQQPLQLGHFSIQTRLTPGHTPGTTSFFFEDTDEKTGNTYLVGMHGGAGTDMMSPEFLEKHNLPQTLAHRFVSDCDEMKKIPVDICLPSHLNQINLVENIPDDLMDYTPYIDRSCWLDFLDERASAVKKFYLEEYEG